MKAEIIFIKNENIDTLSLYNSCETFSIGLSGLGIDTPYISNINNTADTIYDSITNARSRSEIVLIIGACGYDSFCKDILLDMFHCRVQRSSLCSEHMNSQLTKSGLPKNYHSENALYIPDGATIFPDPDSIFCGFSLETPNTVFILLPYTINSAKEISDSLIIPYLTKLFDIKYSSKTITAFDCDKQSITKLTDKLSRRNNANISLKNKFNVYTITVSSFSPSKREALSICKATADKLISELGNDIISNNGDSLSNTTVNLLKANNISVASAESCTGGLLSQMITSVSGASQILEMGICAYSNRIKTKTLGVDPKLIETVGAVSKETACSMAKGVRELSGSDLGIAITGVAGPAASERKPVGTVFIALCDATHFWVRSLNLNSALDRDAIRKISANTAMDLIRRYVVCLPDTMSGYCTADNIFVMSTQPKHTFKFEDKTTASDYFESADSGEYTTFFPVLEANDFSIQTESTESFAEETVQANENLLNFIHTNENYASGFKIDESIINEYSLQSVPENPQENVLQKPSPAKTKKFIPTKKLSIVLFSVLCAVVILAVIMSSYFINTQKSKNLTTTLNEIYKTNSSEYAYSLLKSKNNDYAFWLASNNEEISLPVCTSSDNIFYLNHNFLKKKNNNGTLFVDKKCNLEEGVPRNLIVYGKNLNNGNMLSDLIKYETLSYLNDNNSFIIDNGSENLTYQIFAILITNAKKDDDNGYVFPFTKSNFSSTEDFENWANELKNRSIIKTDIEINFNDKFLTLSTNYNAFENARFVVMAKQVTDVQSVKYSINPNPQYPQIWYDSKGIDNPFKQ